MADVEISEPVAIARFDELPDREPVGVALFGDELVVIRDGAGHSVLSGRCLHRGARLADGKVVGDDLICSLHGWDYRIETGVSAYDHTQCLHKYASAVVDGDVVVDGAEVRAQRRRHPDGGGHGTPVSLGGGEVMTDEYEWHYANPHNDTAEEPHVGEIHALAAPRAGPDRPPRPGGRHGRAAATSCRRGTSIQFVTAQLARLPLLDDEPVDTGRVIGPGRRRPLRARHPGLRLRHELRRPVPGGQDRAVARGAELAGTGICSGEGGMLPEEQAEPTPATSTSWPRPASAGGEVLDAGAGVPPQARPGGQDRHRAATCPAPRSSAASPRCAGLPEGTPAVSPPRFPDWDSARRLRGVRRRIVRERSGGIPVGVKLSAQHIEADLDAALAIGVDYVILDGRGGGTGAAPLIFRDNISVPTIPALARARRHLDRARRRDVTLVATGGIRTPADMAKALALGRRRGGAVQLGAAGHRLRRACGPATPTTARSASPPRSRTCGPGCPSHEAAERLDRFLRAATDLMVVLARACGHRRLSRPHPSTT